MRDPENGGQPPPATSPRGLLRDDDAPQRAHATLVDGFWAVGFVALIFFGIYFAADAYTEADGDWMAKVGGDGGDTVRGRPVQMWLLFGMGLALTAMGMVAVVSYVVFAVRGMKERAVRRVINAGG